ncbi:copper chaperone PCu(A)C [Poseidonocella sp. HB161398]|uniref:copper chaperone PCu(A)C n=1 Tax=Poseidonocella sp. HB161398 TaxID=2320855 RepID=UPI00110870F9|nr:copper chaperone PCu(A)C [Poseidonocella sp. HB161398]
MFRTIALSAALSALAAGAALAGDIAIHDAYARASTSRSVSGAAFMTIENAGAAPDRLIAVASPAAERAELHTHIQDANGVMKMTEVEEGFEIPAHGSHALARGGDHMMLMGLLQPLKQGDMVPVTLTFEKAGEIAIEVPVDLERGPGQTRPGGNHGGMMHGDATGHGAKTQ